jgi:hypothetical protein
MSVILSVYAALAAKTITTTSGVTPTAYDLDELPESVDTAILPCRLLLPLGTQPGDGREGEFIAIGTTMTVVWQLNDLMLWKASEQGLGLKDVADELVDYCGKYMDAMRTFKCPYGTTTSLESVSVTPGMYEWPVGGGRYFPGVLAQLSIREVLSG